jgi:hypothetical protein
MGAKLKGRAILMHKNPVNCQLKFFVFIHLHSSSFVLKTIMMYPLVVLALGLGAAANANPAAQLERRSPYAGGGWALSTSATDQSGCPSGTTWYDAHGWSMNICCPNGFTQQTTGDSNSQLTCCPQGSLIYTYLQFFAKYFRRICLFGWS